MAAFSPPDWRVIKSGGRSAGRGPAHSRCNAPAYRARGFLVAARALLLVPAGGCAANGRAATVRLHVAGTVLGTGGGVGAGVAAAAAPRAAAPATGKRALAAQRRRGAAGKPDRADNSVKACGAALLPRLPRAAASCRFVWKGVALGDGEGDRRCRGGTAER